MSHIEEVLSVFLASPGDVSDERSRTSEVITQWNRAWSRNLGLRLELLRWEDDAYPDLGDDAQSVINRQIPDDWDIFIGIMWSRFGTPTNRAGSGTQEEFERAINRHQSEHGKPNILFYFKDAPIAPSKINADQLQKVQNFKTSAQSKGLLTWDFSDTEQFEKILSLHITKHVQDWRKSKNKIQTIILDSKITPDHYQEEKANDDHDDSGYFDLIEIFTEKSLEVGAIAERITEAQELLTERTIHGQIELQEIIKNPSSSSARKIRESIARVSDEMLKFSYKVEVELTPFRTAIDACVSTLNRIATITAEMYPEQLSEAKGTASTLLSTLTSARQATGEFRDSTAALPRIAKELNIAKRKQVSSLTALMAEFENGEKLLTEGLALIEGLSNRLH